VRSPRSARGGGWRVGGGWVAAQQALRAAHTPARRSRVNSGAAGGQRRSATAAVWRCDRGVAAQPGSEVLATTAPLPCFRVGPRLSNMPHARGPSLVYQPGTVVIMSQLTDAHVLLVGATGGLGTAIARRLAESEARLTLSGRSTDRLAELAAELGDRVVGTASADVTIPDVPDELVRSAHASIGRLDGVVYAAGVVAFGEVVDLDDDVLDQLVLVNLLAPIRLTRAAARVLPSGGFVATLSAVVAEHPQKGMAAYSATKAGLTAFDRAAAAELRRRQIRVIDIRPTHTETGLASRPIAGQSPRLPTGGSPTTAAERIVDAIVNDEKDIPAAAFAH